MRKLIIAIALTAFAGVTGVQAQTYPSRQVTIVVPFPPGGSTDVVGRIMAEKMRPLLGQPVITKTSAAREAASQSGASRVRRPTATRSISASGTPTSAALSIP